MAIYYDEQKNVTTTNPHRIGVYYPCKPSKKSFPANVSVETLEANGFYQTKDVKPGYDAETQQVVAIGWVKEGNQYGTWYYRQYETQAIPEEEMATKARATRDELLGATDKPYGLADYTFASDGDKAEWYTYRQALRDVTSQDGFPYTVEWPIKPTY